MAASEARSRLVESFLQQYQLSAAELDVLQVGPLTLISPVQGLLLAAALRTMPDVRHTRKSLELDRLQETPVAASEARSCLVEFFLQQYQLSA